jgi:hypothetical protein
MEYDRMKETIREHMREVYGWDPEIDQIESMPLHERVWAWWQALAYFGRANHFRRLEDAPDGQEWINVLDAESKRSYRWRNGGYALVQEMTKEVCRGIYGE